MKVIVNVYLKNGVLDPAGKATKHALESLGFNGVDDVRIGKQIILDISDNTTDEQIKNMCEELLANTVIEDYEILKG
ncbi:phosphoribosylformylglycinamidine synthase subunit PurS [Campylobacter devanensis]|uniref:phosphoribosylformylglycinamidine synthase subunit PurS n=1 Tax=Campylobacter devanensis TaxID=3161138 RepID=UPI000A347D3D|nr:phosphoribosylformylglycinamidine synthase subunit PurS [Campylobacter sp. P031]